MSRKINMDIREQEQLQHLGFLGIFKQAYKLTISQWKPIFSTITLALILPLCLLIFADMHVSDHLIGKIVNHHLLFYDAWSYTPQYDHLKHKLIREWIIFVSFNIFYFILGLLVFYLFSISAIVYTVACIYTSKNTTFNQVIRVVPSVWKKLVITFFWNVLILLIFHVVAIGLLVLSLVLVRSNNLVLGITIFAIVVILYLVGLVYINVIWHLASVVSVLEDTCGLRAMKKSRGLMKGKMMVTCGIYIAFQAALIGIQFGYFMLVVALGGSPLLVLIHVIVAIVCFLGVLKVVLLSMVVQTILYFVCKSHHHESIEKASLDELLEGYLGSYGRLGSVGKDVDQLGKV